MRTTTQLSLLAILAGLTLSGCAGAPIDSSSLVHTPAATLKIAEKAKSIGGSYIINPYRGTADDPTGAVQLNAESFLDFAYLEQTCRYNLRRQQPGGVDSIGTSTVAGAASGAIGETFGEEAIGATAQTVERAAKFGAASGAGSGLVNGVVNHAGAKRRQFGSCMSQQVNMAQHNEKAGHLRNYGVLVDSDIVDGTPIARPSNHFAPPPVLIPLKHAGQVDENTTGDEDPH